MASGIGAHQECMEAYQKFKLQNGKKGDKHRYILFTIQNEEVRIQKKADESATWSDFQEDLVELGCAFGLYDYHAEAKDGRIYQKIIFVTWVPDTGKVKDKMKYASTKNAFSQSLGDGLSLQIQANDLDELEEDSIVAKIIG